MCILFLNLLFALISDHLNLTHFFSFIQNTSNVSFRCLTLKSCQISWHDMWIKQHCHHISFIRYMLYSSVMSPNFSHSLPNVNHILNVKNVPDLVSCSHTMPGSWSSSQQYFKTSSFANIFILFEHFITSQPHPWVVFRGDLMSQITIKYIGPWGLKKYIVFKEMGKGVIQTIHPSLLWHPLVKSGATNKL